MAWRTLRVQVPGHCHLVRHFLCLPLAAQGLSHLLAAADSCSPAWMPSEDPTERQSLLALPGSLGAALCHCPMPASWHVPENLLCFPAGSRRGCAWGCHCRVPPWGAWRACWGSPPLRHSTELTKRRCAIKHSQDRSGSKCLPGLLDLSECH